jgi:hypothetical protein
MPPPRHIFIERAMRQDASLTNRHICLSLKQGACVGIFPEGTTTDGKQVGHFHSVLIQSATSCLLAQCHIDVTIYKRAIAVQQPPARRHTHLDGMSPEAFEPEVFEEAWRKQGWVSIRPWKSK